VENVDFDAGTIFTPDSKTESGRRFIPMSSRVRQILEALCEGRSESWVWMSRYKESTLGKGWCTGSGRGRGKPRGYRANSSSTVHATTSAASCWRRPEICAQIILKRELASLPVSICGAQPSRVDRVVVQITSLLILKIEFGAHPSADVA
jgi:hypothetical protein